MAMRTRPRGPEPLRRAPGVSHELAQRIYATVRRIPRGSVSTYGWIAERAGLPRRARLDGHALRVLRSGTGVPWHRVINAQGRSSFPRGSHGQLEQRRRLEDEGVRFVRGRVDRKRCGWRLTLDELLWNPEPPDANSPRKPAKRARR